MLYMFNGLAKIIEAMHGLSEPVQFGVLALIAFIVLCFSMVVIFN